MKIKFLAALMVVFMPFMLSNCKKVDIVDPVGEATAPKVGKITFLEHLMGQNSVSFNVQILGEATSFFYTFEEATRGNETWTEVTGISGNGFSQIDLTSLEAETSYSLKVYAVNGELVSETSEPIPFTTEGLDGTIKVENITEMETYNSAQIKVTTFRAEEISYVYYEKDQRPADASIEWKTMTIDSDGEVLIDVTGLQPSTESRTVYTFEVKGVDYKGNELESETANFQTLRTDVMVFSDAIEGMFSITLDVDLVTELANSYYLYFEEAQYYDDFMFFQDLGTNFGAKPITKDSTFVFGTGWPEVRPGVEYKALFLAANTSETGEILEHLDTVILELKAMDFAFGGTDKSLTLKAVPEKTAYSVVGFNVARDPAQKDEVTRFYFGAVKKSDVTGTLEEHLLSSGWFNNFPSNTDFIEYDEQYNPMEVDAKDVTIQNLAPETEYYAFAVPRTVDGKIGKLSQIEISTGAFAADPNVQFTYGEVVPSFTSIKITDIAFTGGTTKIMYSISPKGEKTFEEAEDALIAALSAYAPTIYAQGDATISIIDPKVNTEYDIFLMPVNSSTQLPGHVVHLTTKTKEITFDNGATLEVSHLSTVADGNWIDVKLNVNFTGTTVGYYQNAFDLQIFWDQGVSDPTDEQIARHLIITANLLSSTYSFIAKEGEYLASMYGDGARRVMFIPVDLNGNIGTIAGYTPVVE